MGTRFLDGQGSDVYQGVHVVKVLTQSARKIKEFVREQFADDDSAHEDVTYAGDGPNGDADFRLNTPFGTVQAEFSVVRVDGSLAGRYTFFRLGSNPVGEVEAKKVYAFLFSSRGYASFDESLQDDWVLPTEGRRSEQSAYKLAFQLLGSLLAEVEDIAPPSGF